MAACHCTFEEGFRRRATGWVCGVRCSLIEQKMGLSLGGGVRGAAPPGEEAWLDTDYPEFQGVVGKEPSQGWMAINPVGPPSISAPDTDSIIKPFFCYPLTLCELHSPELHLQSLGVFFFLHLLCYRSHGSLETHWTFRPERLSSLHTITITSWHRKIAQLPRCCSKYWRMLLFVNTKVQSTGI